MVLESPDPRVKIAVTHAAHRLLAGGAATTNEAAAAGSAATAAAAVGVATAPPQPARPARPELVHLRAMPCSSSPAPWLAHMLHNLAHVESNALTWPNFPTPFSPLLPLPTVPHPSPGSLACNPQARPRLPLTPACAHAAQSSPRGSISFHTLPQPLPPHPTAPHRSPPLNTLPNDPPQVHPRAIPKPGPSSPLPWPAHMLHNLAHVELNAIDLAWDTVVRFSALGAEGEWGVEVGRGELEQWERGDEEGGRAEGGGEEEGRKESSEQSWKLPRQFFLDFVHVADDESRHLAWCLQRLEEMGYRWDAVHA
ncbi:unnamed protein product, partial [Closterium sp. Naga37s-1]